LTTEFCHPERSAAESKDLSRERVGHRSKYNDINDPQKRFLGYRPTLNDFFLDLFGLLCYLTFLKA
jgi:hypothetical protein